MPEAPGESILCRYLLENPYPLGGALLVAGLLFGWFGLQAGRTTQTRVAGVLLVLGAVVMIVGRSVVTAGEHANAVVDELVVAIEQEDLVAAVDQFAADASLHYGQTTSVGHDLDRITSGLSRLARDFTIESNVVTGQRAYTESADRATVHIACRTDAGVGFPAVSQWVVRVERRGEDWKITKLTFISINGRPPSANR